ncbi:hypothetical protein ABT300_08900 [Streptomyces sp. NPDC001027]|uniref:hypothetical protein n=1 Tax=Streptomyces sp. NPDC001027 TaxID=3154771 RepID=UPI003320521C
MVDEGTNYVSGAGRLSTRPDLGEWVRGDAFFGLGLAPGAAIRKRELPTPPPPEKSPGLLSRIADVLLPARREQSGHTRPSGEGKEPPAADPILTLAYEALSARLNSQSTTLESLRTRATGILSVAALVTSFAAGIGMINTDPEKGDLLPTWAPWALLGILTVMGYCVMRVLWPYKRWAYGPSGKVIIELWEKNRTENEVREVVAREMVRARDRNEGQVVKRAWYYRGAVVLLLAETLTLVAAIAEQATT